MDIIPGIREEIKRTLLYNIFQGLLILSPFFLAFIKCLHTKTITPNEMEIIKDYSSISFFGAFVLCLAIGHMTLKMGHRLEVNMAATIYLNDIEYDRTWEKYLKTFFDKAKEPVIVRYYSNFIVGLRFELATLIALPFSYLFALIIDQNCISIIPYYIHGPLFISFFLVMIYLYSEAKDGIIQADKLRSEIVRSFRLISNYPQLVNNINNP